MQGRHRNPNGIGQRIGPDESGYRGDGSYGSGYRNYGRGGKYRRGPGPQSPPFVPPPPPPPPSKEEIFMEAGRLAAEYLVARGILPQNSLPPVWEQNCGYRESRGREREHAGRASAPDRINTGNSDTGHGRRWYSDEYGHSGGHFRRGSWKRSTNYSRSHGTDWGRESGRSGGWMERTRNFNDYVDDDEDGAPGYRRRGGEYRGRVYTSKAVVGSEVASRGEVVESESDLDNIDDGSMRAGSSNMKEDVSRDTEIESNRESDTRKVEDMETEQEMETQSAEVGKIDEMEVNLSSASELIDMDQGSNHVRDLLKLCRSLKVPTRLRSSVANRAGKNGQNVVFNEASTSNVAPVIELENEEELTVADNEIACKSPVFHKNTDSPITEELNRNQIATNEVTSVVESEVVVLDKDVTDKCSCDDLPGATQNVSSLSEQDSTCRPVFSREEGPTLAPAAEKKAFTSTVSSSSSFPKSLPVQHPSELVTEASFTADKKTSRRPYPFPDSSSAVHLAVDSSKSLLVSEASGVASEVRIDDGFTQESGKNKSPKDWYSHIISHVEDCTNVCDSNGRHFGSQGRVFVADEQMAEATEQGKMDDMRLFQRTEPDSQGRSEEDVPHLSSSFKIRDLNLMGTPEITDIPDDPIQEHLPGTAAILQAGNAPSVDFGLSIGNTSINGDMYGGSSNGIKVVQLIDLEDDSPVNPGVCDPSKPSLQILNHTRSEAMYNNLENFLNNSESAVDLADIQDGYSRSITDLLGSDITSCSPVAADISSPQPGMTLHGAEMAGDDDSIYVSLGEIPIGFMDIWESPQGYGKFF